MDYKDTFAEERAELDRENAEAALESNEVDDEYYE